jgi:hypothetical protein
LCASGFLFERVVKTLVKSDEVRFTGAAAVARLSALPAKRRVPATSVASAAAVN